MRVLHAIRSEENLVSRGQYRYLVDGESTGDVESWQVSRLPSGEEIVRADLDGRRASGASLITHFVRHKDGSPDWLRMRFHVDGVNAAAQYTFDEASVRIARTADNIGQQIDIVDLPAGYVVDYHTMISQDYVWRGCKEGISEPRMVPLFSPDLWAEGEKMLRGRALRFEGHALPPETCSVPAGEFANAQHFSIRFEDGVVAKAWYDEHGTPLRWFFPARSYNFVLEQYTRRD